MFYCLVLDDRAQKANQHGVFTCQFLQKNILVGEIFLIVLNFLAKKHANFHYSRCSQSVLGGTKLDFTDVIDLPLLYKEVKKIRETNLLSCSNQSHTTPFSYNFRCFFSENMSLQPSTNTKTEIYINMNAISDICVKNYAEINRFGNKKNFSKIYP